MMRWIVGGIPDKTVVAKSIDGLDKVPQPVTMFHKLDSTEIEWESGSHPGRLEQFATKIGPSRRGLKEGEWAIQDKDGKVKYTGHPGGVDSGCWFIVKEMVGKNGMEYVVNRVDEWFTFSSCTAAQRSAPDLETSELMMKEARVKSRTEFNEYLKNKRIKAEQKGMAVPEQDDEFGEKISFYRKKINQKKLFLKKLKGGDGDDLEVAESSVAYIGLNKDVEGEWEGEEAFSDDDEQILDEQANYNLEHDIEVSDEDVDRDKAAPEDEDVEAQSKNLLKDAFGDEIEKIIQEEYQKEHIADDDLDIELKKFSNVDEDEECSLEVLRESPVPSAKKGSVPAVEIITSKDEQIRARVKGMFWRSEYKLKLKDVLSQFPGLNRSSEEYQFLTKALKDLADVRDGELHLKKQYRK